MDFYVTKLTEENLTDFCIIYSNWNNDSIKLRILEFKSSTRTIDKEWEGQLSNADLVTSADELDIPYLKFIDECKSALSTNDHQNTFVYRIQNDKTFILQKNEKYKSIYIEANVHQVDNLKDQLLLDCVNLINQQNSKLKENELKIETMNGDYEKIIQSYRRFIKEKESLEDSLLSKFRVLLNSKKEKIAELQQMLLDKTNNPNSNNHMEKELLVSSEKESDYENMSTEENDLSLTPTPKIIKLPRRVQADEKHENKTISQKTSISEPSCSKIQDQIKSIYDQDTEAMLDDV